MKKIKEGSEDRSGGEDSDTWDKMVREGPSYSEIYGDPGELDVRLTSVKLGQFQKLKK